MEEKQLTEKKTDKRLKNLKPAWKKGEQGGGHRQKGQRNYETLRKLAIIEIGKANGKTPEEIEIMLHQKGIAEALKGDFRFYKDDLDRVHGQARLKLGLDGGEDGKPIGIDISKILKKSYGKKDA